MVLPNFITQKSSTLSIFPYLAIISYLKFFFNFSVQKVEIFFLYPCPLVYLILSILDFLEKKQQKNTRHKQETRGNHKSEERKVNSKSEERKKSETRAKSEK